MQWTAGLMKTVSACFVYCILLSLVVVDHSGILYLFMVGLHKKLYCFSFDNEPSGLICLVSRQLGYSQPTIVVIVMKSHQYIPNNDQDNEYKLLLHSLHRVSHIAESRSNDSSLSLGRRIWIYLYNCSLLRLTLTLTWNSRCLIISFLCDMQ